MKANFPRFWRLRQDFVRTSTFYQVPTKRVTGYVITQLHNTSTLGLSSPRNRDGVANWNFIRSGFIEMLRSLFVTARRHPAVRGDQILTSRSRCNDVRRAYVSHLYTRATMYIGVQVSSGIEKRASRHAHVARSNRGRNIPRKIGHR